LGYKELQQLELLKADLNGAHLITDLMLKILYSDLRNGNVLHLEVVFGDYALLQCCTQY